MNVWIYAVGFAAACLLAVLLTPVVKRIAFKVGAISVPNQRSVHTKNMPLMGGLAMVLSFMVVYFLIAPWTSSFNWPMAMGLLVGGSVIALTGALDDRFNLPPKLKLLGQLIAASIVVMFGLQVDFLGFPFSDVLHLNNWMNYDWFGITITILWIVGVTNAINLLDGLDGLAAGVSAIGTGTIMVLAFMTGQYSVALCCAVLLGSILGFLFFNFHPAKIFMGDTGSLFLGFALATLSILGYKQATVIQLIVPVLILGVPITDTFLAIVRRKLHNKPISVADKGHLHHCLMRLGLSMRKTVLTIYAISFIFGVCAVVVSQLTMGWALVLSAFLLLVLEVGAEAIGIISRRRKPVLTFLAKLGLVRMPRRMSK